MCERARSFSRSARSAKKPARSTKSGGVARRLSTVIPAETLIFHFRRIWISPKDREEGKVNVGMVRGNHIYIDLMHDEQPAKIFLHELIHYIDPFLSEKEVLRLERYYWSRMTQRDRFNLYKALFSQKWRT